jgi:hypothetical protein
MPINYLEDETGEKLRVLEVDGFNTPTFDLVRAPHLLYPCRALLLTFLQFNLLLLNFKYHHKV